MPTSFKVFGAGVLLTLVGFIFVQEDIRLRLWGKKVDADIMQSFDIETTSRRGRTSSRSEVVYRFTDDKGAVVQGGVTFSLGDPRASAATLPVVYLSGKPSVNRYAGTSTWYWYVMFLGGIVLVLVGRKIFLSESIVEAHRQTERDMDASRDRGITGGVVSSTVRNLMR